MGKGGLLRRDVVRRCCAGALMVLVVTGPAVGEDAAAARRRARVEVEVYEATALGILYVDPTAAAFAPDEVSFFPEPGERQVSVVLEDETGLPVRGIVVQGEAYERFCGETKEPFAITPDEAVQVRVYTGPCDGGVGVTTTGTVRATFK